MRCERAPDGGRRTGNGSPAKRTESATISAAEAIFIQDAAGLKPAMQVTSCDWNAQHPKWFPPGSTGDKVVLIEAVAKADETQFHIATIDVTGFCLGALTCRDRAPPRIPLPPETD
jgi:hypothetical protein